MTGSARFSSKLSRDDRDDVSVGECGSLTSSSAPPASPMLMFVEKESNESRFETVSRRMKTGSVPRPLDDVICFEPNELDTPDDMLAVVYPTFFATELNARR